MEQKLIGLSEAGRLLGVSSTRVRQLIAEGKLARSPLVARPAMVNELDVLRLDEERGTAPPSRGRKPQAAQTA